MTTAVTELDTIAGREIVPVPVAPTATTPLPTAEELTVCTAIANAMVKGGVQLPKDARSADAVLIKMLIGREHGLPPMAALTEIDLIEGKACLNARTKVAIVRRRGLGNIELVESTNPTATVTVTRADWPPDRQERVTWTIEDANKAQLLTKTNWRRYPRAMLAARAESEACTKYFQEVFLGLPHTADELGYETDEAGRVLQALLTPASGPAPSPFTPATIDAQAEPPITPAGDLDAPAGEAVAGTRTPPWTRSPASPAPAVTTAPKADGAPVSDGKAATADTAPPPAKGAKLDLPAPAATMTSCEQAKHYIRTLGIDQPTWRRIIATYGAESFVALSPLQQSQLLEWLDRLRVIRILRAWLGLRPEQWSAALAKRGVSSEYDLRRSDVEAIHEKLWNLTTPFDRQSLGLESAEASTGPKELPPTNLTPAESIAQAA